MRIASGGELSRIALALKTCFRQAVSNGAPPTLVFDEIDAGIGGAVAESVGRRLKKLAASNQVLCVTHLAQVAGFADHHYLVEKREVKGPRSQRSKSWRRKRRNARSAACYRANG